MKTSVAFALLAAILVPAAVLGQATMDYVSTVQGTSGLLGYWRFDTGSQANSLVNGYTGSFMGNATLGALGAGPSLAVDANNRALVLDGSGDYVTTNLVGGITTGGSVIAWVNLAILPSSASRIFTIAGQSQNGNDFDLQIETDNRVHFYNTTAGGVASPSTLTTNTWVFVAATFTNGGTREVFINGASVASSAAGNHNGASPNPLSIGENIVFPSRYFQGSIDEVAVFNRALSASEVANIYAAAQVIPEPAEISLLGGALALGAAVGWRRRFG